MPDRRDPETCDYSNAALSWTPILMYMGRLGARRLEDFRLLGQYYLVTFDLSGYLYLGDRASDFTEGCLTQATEDGRTLYYRPVCEAKLVTRTGLALSVGSEFVENPPGLNPGQAQDSELPAAERLFPRVKAAFRGFAFCALLDARYCNETGFSLCEKNDWRFLITLKEGALPSVWNEFQTLREIAPGNRRLHVLECRWNAPDGTAHRFVRATDIRISAENCDPLAQEGGRQRWRTENEGFRAQKHGGFEMEHAYAKRPVSAKNFYLLLQVAHILSRMLECYCDGKKAVKHACGSLRNLGAALLESLRRDPAADPDALRIFLEEPIQIRLNTS